MNKKIVNILIICSILLIIISFSFSITCLFKKIVGIPCISCGLTRSFIAIFHFKFHDAIKYNVLGIPIFLFCLLFYILYIYSVIFKKDTIYNLYEFISQKYLLLILFLLIGWLFNILNFYNIINL